MSSLYSANSWYEDSGSRRRASMVPLLVGGALAVVALAGQTKIGAWLRGFFSVREFEPTDELRRRVHAGWPLEALRESILGRRKVTIAGMFGPPKTAVVTRAATASVTPNEFFRADTWYYALDARSQTALAVMFEDGVAQSVDFFDAPQ
jgi:hypothetical protein